MRRILALFILLAALAPVPAFADGLSSGYLTTVSGIAIPGDTTHLSSDQIEKQIPTWKLVTLPGVSATSPKNGESITVQNSSATPLVVHGYSGSYTYDAYLTISSKGIYTNSRADTACLNQSVTLATGCKGNDHAAPVWTKTKSADIYEWHDHRIHWMGAEQPPGVQSSPHDAQLIDNWAIPFTYAGKHYAFVGTLSWKPGGRLGSYLIWIVVAVAVVALVVVQFVIRPRRRSSEPPHPPTPAGP